MVNNSTNINQNHLSLQLIEWWSTIQLNEFRWEVIFVDIGGIVDHHQYQQKYTSHHNSLSDCQQFHQCQQQSLLTTTHWVMVNNSTTNINKNHPSIQFIEWWSTIPLNELWWEVIVVDIGGIVDNHSMNWIEGWFLLILVVELLTITQWVKVRGDFCWYWWNCWPSPKSTKVTSHLITLSDGQQFHQYQQKSPLTLTHWVMVNNSTQCQQFHQYQQKSPLTSTHWVMVNNSTNITTNHLSLQLIEWKSTIPPKSTRITSHLNSLSDGQQFHSMSWSERWFLLILVELLTITQWV